MKKFSLGLAFAIVFMLGIILGFGISKIGSKSNQQALSSNTEVDFSQFAMDDEEVVEPTSEQAESSAAEEVSTEDEQVSSESDKEDEEDNDDEEDEDDDKKSDAPYLGDFDKDECAKLNAEREKLYAQPDSYENTMAIAEIDKKIVALNTYNFGNKKIAFLGDSITLGKGGNVLGQDQYFGFDDYMEEMLDIGEKVNVGEGGSTIGKYNDDSCFEKRAKKKIDDDVDIIIVMGGINDYINGKKYFGEMRNLTNGETYCGAVDKLFYTLHERWDADVFVVTPYGIEIEKEGKDKGIEFSEYIDAQVQLYEKYHLNMFNLYETGFLNTNVPEIKDKLSADGIHLNNEGYKLLGQHIAADLVSYYGNWQYR